MSEKRGRPSKVELEKENAELEAQITEVQDSTEAIKRAMEFGRERTDPRGESEVERDGGRIPLGAPHQKLSLRGYKGILDGYTPRWITNRDGRVIRALEAGYTPVMANKYLSAGDGDNQNTDMGTWVSQSSGGDRLYLMQIRSDLYEADQELKREKDREIIREIKGGHIGSPGGGEGDAESRYIKHLSIQGR